MPSKKYVVFHETKGFLSISKDPNKKDLMFVWTKERHEAKEFSTFFEADANILPQAGEKVLKV